jgi:hypothetical protein
MDVAGTISQRPRRRRMRHGFAVLFLGVLCIAGCGGQALAGTATGLVVYVQSADLIRLEIRTSTDATVQTGSTYMVSIIGVESLGDCSSRSLAAQAVAEAILLNRELQLDVLEPPGAGIPQSLRAVLSFAPVSGSIGSACYSFSDCSPAGVLLTQGMAVIASDDFFDAGNGKYPAPWLEESARTARSGLWRDFQQRPIQISHADPEAEYIVLLNTSYEAQSLAGWSLTDGEGCYRFPDDTPVLAASEPRLVKRAEYNPFGATRGLSLDKEQERLFLLSPDGYIVHFVEWGMPWQQKQ